MLSECVEYRRFRLTSNKATLADLNVPLYVVSHSPRKTLPARVISLLSELKARHLFANIEHEVDELRRDIQVCELGKTAGVSCSFVHDKCIIAPGTVHTKEGKTYTVSLLRGVGKRHSLT